MQIPNVEDVARWLRPTMPSPTGVFEAGGINPGVERAGANGVLQIPMAKVFKVSALSTAKISLVHLKPT